MYLSLVQLAVNVPQVLEVLDSPNLEVQGRVLVADHQGSRVLLEGGDGPHVVHSFFHCLDKYKN